MEEQYIYNYLALTACLISDKPLSTTQVEKVIQVTTGQNVSDKKVSKERGQRIIVIDIVSNKETIFESQGDASRYLGVNRRTAGIYIASGKTYKNRYIFKRA